MGERVTVEELRKQKAEIYSIGEWITYNCEHVPPDLLAGLRAAAQVVDRAADTLRASERKRDELKALVQNWVAEVDRLTAIIKQLRGTP